MPVYVIRGDTVAAHAEAPAHTGPNDVIVRAQADLMKSPLGNAQLAAVWNALPGTTPVTKFKDRATAARRLWAAFAALPPAAGKPARAGRPATRRARASGSSKQAQVIALLSRPAGASLDALVAATGWQRHTVRGVIAGALKKRLGLTVVASKDGDGARIYRIPG